MPCITTPAYVRIYCHMRSTNIEYQVPCFLKFFACRRRRHETTATATATEGGGYHGGERGGGARVRVVHAGRGGEVPGHVAHTRHLPKDGVVDITVHLRRLHRGHQEGAGLLALRRVAKGAVGWGAVLCCAVLCLLGSSLPLP